MLLREVDRGRAEMAEPELARIVNNPCKEPSKVSKSAKSLKLSRRNENLKCLDLDGVQVSDCDRTK